MDTIICHADFFVNNAQIGLMNLSANVLDNPVSEDNTFDNVFYKTLSSLLPEQAELFNTGEQDVSKDISKLVMILAQHLGNNKVSHNLTASDELKDNEVVLTDKKDSEGKNLETQLENAILPYLEILLKLNTDADSYTRTNIDGHYICEFNGIEKMDIKSGLRSELNVVEKIETNNPAKNIMFDNLKTDIFGYVNSSKDVEIISASGAAYGNKVEIALTKKDLNNKPENIIPQGDSLLHGSEEGSSETKTVVKLAYPEKLSDSDLSKDNITKSKKIEMQVNPEKEGVPLTRIIGNGELDISNDETLEKGGRGVISSNRETDIKISASGHEPFKRDSNKEIEVANSPNNDNIIDSSTVEFRNFYDKGHIKTNPNNLPFTKELPDIAVVHDSRVIISKGEISSIQVSLNTDEIGSLDIELVMDRGVINGHINATDPLGKELLEKTLYRLIETLTKDGLNIGGFSVSLRDRESGLPDYPKDGGFSSTIKSSFMQENIPSYVNRGLINIFV